MASENPFGIVNPFKGRVSRGLFEPVRWCLDRLIGLDGINDLYRTARDSSSDSLFADRVLEALDVEYRVSESDLARLPATGAAVVVANHCFGGLEGIILNSLLKSVRADSKIMANYMLGRIPEMAPDFLLVDPFGGKGARRANSKPLRECFSWLRGGGMLAAFPSGEVAHYELKRNAVVEPPWSRTLPGLIRRTNAVAVPMYFEGGNSALFHVLGAIHPRLRTIRLPRELLNKRGRVINVHIGHPIPARKLTPLGPDEEVAEYLQMRAYNLRHRRQSLRRPVLRLPRLIRHKAAVEEPVIAPWATEALVADVDALPPSQNLVRSGEMEVWYASASQIPSVLKEIGRLREMTFRAVGEGTGKALDLDAYDEYYMHLFLWNTEAQEVAAAYRLGETDTILASHGLKGLYTRSLFRYNRKLLERLGPSLEMGRSFVRESYQRSYTSLLLMWKGIGQYVVRHPKYRVLFGPVSISDSYRSYSRDLLVRFLKVNRFLPGLAKLVHARTPLRRSFLKKLRDRKLQTVAENLEDVEALIADIETEMGGVPILLKQYLRLGGKLAGFNLDPEFSHVLDGLIVVDLTQADRRALKRYLTPEGLASFLEYHGVE